MKAGFWFYLWLILLVLQILTFWVNRPPGGKGTSVFSHPDPALLELARQTCRQFESIGAGPGDPEPGKLGLSSGDELLLRESLILRLGDIEGKLLEAGTRTSVVAELVAWLDTRGFQDPVYPASRYIQALLDWLGRFQGPATGCSLEGLALHPDASSDFPSISFELTGQPASMGKSLLAPEGELANWQIRELDIFYPGDSRQWWMRGSLSFSAARNSQ